jgi:RNA recognition motif-containing protein
MELLETPPQVDSWWADVRISPTASMDRLLPAGLCDENQNSNTNTLKPTALEDFAYLDVQYPGELEDRRVIISNLSPDVTVDKVCQLAQSFGDVESSHIDPVTHVATVKFFDLRSAHRMQGARIGNWATQFAPPEAIANKKRPPNNGTIVIFHLKVGVSDDAIRAEFARFGEIRQIRSPPGRDTQRFVEYWDTRHARKALNGTKGKTICGSKVSVEFSLPGGAYRKNAEVWQQNRPPVISRKTVVPCTISF